MKPTGTNVLHLKRRPHGEPLPTTTAVPNPGDRYSLGRRIEATLANMIPESHESFLVDNVFTAYDAAKRCGFQICTRQDGKKFRVWRLA